MKKKLVIPAIRLQQWLPEWDKVQFNDTNADGNYRKRPEKFMFLFSIKASLLRRLAKVYRRRTDDKRYTELGTQRKHDEERSKEIGRYIIHGYPLSEILNSKQAKEEVNDLRMPGWLPTSILANILPPGTKRGNGILSARDAILIKDNTMGCFLELPDKAEEPKWQPESFPPIEIIDGQHRLWAFDAGQNVSDDFELPVIAFYGLDITWQAYLFYTINVKPKKINRSLAYDLYPILRVQDWLEKSPDTANIYRETRAQELVEILWSYNDSPWKDKINMLGDTKTNTNITQAAFIRNLIASFIKTKISKNLGGLYGSSLGKTDPPLDWNRTQQAAFLIYFWQLLFESVKNSKKEWAVALRDASQKQLPFEDRDKYNDMAFWSKHALISKDQGVRGILSVLNDLCYLNAKALKLHEIPWENMDVISESRIKDSEIAECITSLKKSNRVREFIRSFCVEIVNFNWRSSSEPSLLQKEKLEQMVYKGSSGYRELRKQLLELLKDSKNSEISHLSTLILRSMNG